jgi:hypothetical protein
MPNRRVRLDLIAAPSVGHVVDAPPVLKASDHSVDYTCGRCDTVLLHAEEGQVRGVPVHEMRSYNATKS